MPSTIGLLSLLAGLTLAVANPLKTRSKTPVVQSTQLLGYFGDPTINRDSCGSSKVGDRELWTCRDSQNYPGGDGFFYTSTASWSDFYSDGIPLFQNGNLTGYGQNSGPFFPLPSNECGDNGSCSDGTRWVGWPDTRPLPMQYYGGAWYMYSWIPNIHLSGLTNLNGPPYQCSLYRMYFSNTDTDDLPPVTLLNQAFWNGICYGDYGWTLSADNTTAYLYGTTSSGVAVARVPLYSVEQISDYEFYNAATNSWSTTIPSYDDASANVPNAGTGYQGTFYYSDYFGSYVWIGASYGVGSDFQITTAPNPEGPWEKPTQFYVGPSGTAGLQDYSQQAHPGLSQWGGQGRDIYISYTMLSGSDDNVIYATPLIHVVWE